MKKLVVSLVLALTLASFTSAERPEHELHAMMLYNFIKYIKWPSSSEEFTIAVMGNENVYTTLNEWYGGKQRVGKKITVIKFSKISDFRSCDILYLGNGIKEKFSALKSRIKNNPTLLVTNRPGLGRQGSCINFKNVDNKLKFELNQRAIEAADLKVSNQLAAMAILI